MTIQPHNSYLATTSYHDFSAGPVTAYQPSTYRAAINSPRLQQAVQSLGSHLSQANLVGAVAAYQTLQGIFTLHTTSGGGIESANLYNDLTALGSALSTTDLFTARSVFATFISDLKDSQMNASFDAAQSVTLAEELLSTADSVEDYATNYSSTYSSSNSWNFNSSNSVSDSHSMNVFA
jgi:hypothetical protein